MTNSMTAMPGGNSRRPLHFCILARRSGSMKADGRMQALTHRHRQPAHPARDSGPGSPDEDTIV